MCTQFVRTYDSFIISYVNALVTASVFFRPFKQTWKFVGVLHYRVVGGGEYIVQCAILFACCLTLVHSVEFSLRLIHT